MAKAQPTVWTDELLIREIRAGERQRNRAWEYIYKAWRGYYMSPVRKMGGKVEEVDKVLAGVVLDVEKQVLKDDFALREATLRTFFVGCVIRAWAKAKELEKYRNSRVVGFDPQTHLSGPQGELEAQLIRRERLERLDTLIARLGVKCQKVLTLYRQDYSMREIADAMGFKNEQSAKNEKKNCQTKLLEITDEL